jgi:hypothetical protein
VASRVQAGRVISPLEPGTRRPPVDPIAPRKPRSRRASPMSSRGATRPRQAPGRQRPPPAVPPGLGPPKSPAGAGTFFGLAASEFPGNRHLLRQRGYRRMRALSPSTDIRGFPGCRRLERPLPRRFRTLIPAAFRPRAGALRPRRAAPIARRAAGGPACGIRRERSRSRARCVGRRAAPRPRRRLRPSRDTSGLAAIGRGANSAKRSPVARDDASCCSPAIARSRSWSPSCRQPL